MQRRFTSADSVGDDYGLCRGFPMGSEALLRPCEELAEAVEEINQACTHCHVEAGPQRQETMSRETADQVLAFLSASDVRSLDLTGGAPEIERPAC